MLTNSYTKRKSRLRHGRKKGKQCEGTGRRQPRNDNERGLEQILPSQPREGIKPADALVLDFWLVEL